MWKTDRKSVLEFHIVILQPMNLSTNLPEMSFLTKYILWASLLLQFQTRNDTCVFLLLLMSVSSMPIIHLQLPEVFFIHYKFSAINIQKFIIFFLCLTHTYIDRLSLGKSEQQPLRQWFLIGIYIQTSKTDSLYSDIF